MVKLAVAIQFRLAPGSIPGRCNSFLLVSRAQGAVVALWDGLGALVVVNESGT